jgi:hypothetical protein
MSEKLSIYRQMAEDFKVNTYARDTFYTYLDSLNDEMDKIKTPDIFRADMLYTFFNRWDEVLMNERALNKDIENRGGEWITRYINRNKLRP